MTATTNSTAPPVAPAHRGRGSWLLLTCGLIVALATAYGAYALAGWSWNQVVDYASPFTTLHGETFTGPRPPLDTPIPGAQARRAVIVLIDGLTDAASRSMPTIEALRARGADVRLTIPQPSLSYPMWTTAFTGAPPQISGVTTNWYDRRVEVESLFDVAVGSGRALAVSGPDDLDALFGVSKLTSATALIPWGEGEYRSGRIVDAAIRLGREHDAQVIVALLPDVDDVGHAHGAASSEYAGMTKRVDADLARLVEVFDDGETVFAVFPDHGHTATGGHGGWEDPVIHTFAVFAGPGVKHTTTEARLEDVAPTVAVLAGMQAPALAMGSVIDAVLTDGNGRARDANVVRAAGVTLAYARKVAGAGATDGIESIGSAADRLRIIAAADAERAARDRRERLPVALAIALAAAVVLAVVGLASWRALVASLAGALTYTVLYNAAFFWLHGYRWSLSTFNEESMIQAFFNGRMAETVAAALIGSLVAGLVYVALRARPRGPEDGFTAGWLALGVTTVLAAQALLAWQVAWFWWYWGAQTVWRLPDLMWGFKYDLDLVQMTALGAAAVLAPAVTYLVGRVHPRVRAARASA